MNFIGEQIVNLVIKNCDYKHYNYYADLNRILKHDFDFFKNYNWAIMSLKIRDFIINKMHKTLPTYVISHEANFIIAGKSEVYAPLKIDPSLIFYVQIISLDKKHYFKNDLFGNTGTLSTLGTKYVKDMCREFTAVKWN